MLGSLPNIKEVESFQQGLRSVIAGSNKQQEEEGSSFSFRFMVNENEYGYAFKFFEGKVVSEELYQFVVRRGEQKKEFIFKRDGGTLKGTVRLKKSKTWYSLTRKDVLYLTVHPETRDLFPRVGCEVSLRKKVSGAFLERLKWDTALSQRVVALLQKLDERVVGVSVEFGCVETKRGLMPIEFLPRAMGELLALSEKLFLVIDRGGYWVIDDWDCYSEKVCRIIEGVLLDCAANPLGVRLLYTCGKDVCFSKETRDARYVYSG
jgi:hypothetical protein